MSTRPSTGWSRRVSTPRGLAQTNAFAARLFEVIDLIRACRLDAAHALASQIRTEALAVGDDEAAGRSSSSLGEIAGIRGELEAAMREYGVAIERLEHTDLAGSISRAYRGWAYCYLMFQMPRLALQPAREARRMEELIDVAETRDRARFECAICEGLVQIELMNIDEAHAHWQSVEHLVARMADVDDWLPGLFNLLGGRVRVEQGKLTGDTALYAAGIDTLEHVVEDFRTAGLTFWTARAHDTLGRAREEEHHDEAVRHVRAAASIYRDIGAAQLLESAEQWLRSVRPASPNRYVESPGVVRPNRLSPQVTVVEEQLVAGPKTREIVERAMRYAQLPHPVLVMGESGTGKEGIARIIHSSGPRKGEFVPLNCAAFPEALVESMLFGHRRGAFTGAAGNHGGLIRQADGGTLFLDEIGEMSLDLQPKLLRFLETGRTLTIGETVEREVDVRVVAATNRDLEQAVNEGRFREDLYYRLNVLRLTTAPLRDRIEEVPRLAQFIAGPQDAKLTMGALNALSAYDWPGNVRQLRNVIFRALGAEHGTVIVRSTIEQELAAEMRRTPNGASRAATEEPPANPAAKAAPVLAAPSTAWPFLQADGSLPPGMPLVEAEREFQRFHIARALARHNGNRTRAARDLGLKLQTFCVRAQKLGII